MITIQTTLGRADSDENITIELKNRKAFNDVFGLGLILNSKDPTSGEFAIDAKGLRHAKDHLEYVQNDCLWGISGIAALMTAANPADLGKTDMESIGIVIKNLASLAEEAKDHLESINDDITHRAGLISNPEQAAYHFKMHQEATTIRKSKSMDYSDAVALAAGRLAVRQAKESGKEA